MTIWNLGSINVDHVYRVPHLPAPGETLAADEVITGLGGKGANMSVAAARGAGRVCHIGAVGVDGLWARDRLLEYGVNTRHITRSDAATGHAIIAIDAAGENNIILYSGANDRISEDQVGAALSMAAAGDIFLTQSETNAPVVGARMARDMGLRVVYSAAPFDVAAVEAMLPLTDVLIVNEVEKAQLETHFSKAITDLGVACVVVTLGGDGVQLFEIGSEPLHVPAVEVEVVDTTGAGDTFAGFFVAGLDRSLSVHQAVHLATQAAGLMVTRLGTADVIPDLKDIEDWRLGGA